MIRKWSKTNLANTRMGSSHKKSEWKHESWS